LAQAKEHLLTPVCPAVVKPKDSRTPDSSFEWLSCAGGTVYKSFIIGTPSPSSPATLTQLSFRNSTLLIFHINDFFVSWSFVLRSVSLTDRPLTHNYASYEKQYQKEEKIRNTKYGIQKRGKY